MTLQWESFEKRGGDGPAWDTHRNHFEIVKDFRAPVLDQVFSALCEDMEASGPIRVSQVESEQKAILQVVRRLADNGEIVLTGGDDAYV